MVTALIQKLTTSIHTGKSLRGITLREIEVSFSKSRSIRTMFVITLGSHLKLYNSVFLSSNAEISIEKK